MMVEDINRIHNPMSDRATGLLAPCVRAATHLGYLLGALSTMSNDDYNDTIRTEAATELQQAIRHGRDGLDIDPGAFLSAGTLEIYQLCIQQTVTLKDDIPTERTAIIDVLQTLLHNWAWCAALFEADTVGNSPHEGTLP